MVVKNQRLRYILIEFFQVKPVEKQFLHELRSNYSKLHGEVSLSLSGLTIIESPEPYLTIRCRHSSRKLVEATLTLSKHIHRVLTVSGTIKGLDKTIKLNINDNEENF